MAAILELDEHLNRDFTIFEAAPQVSVLFMYLGKVRLNFLRPALQTDFSPGL